MLRRLLEATAPKSHAEIAEELAQQGFDRATVYRNLVELAEVGLANRMELGDHVWRYEMKIVGEGDDHHPHFVCTECGKVECLEHADFDLKPKAGSTKSSIARISSVLLKGCCAGCAAAGEET